MNLQMLFHLNLAMKLINKDKMNIMIVKKYLFISSRLKLIFVNINLFIKTFLGLLKDKI